MSVLLERGTAEPDALTGGRYECMYPVLVHLSIPNVSTTDLNLLGIIRLAFLSRDDLVKLFVLLDQAQFAARPFFNGF